MPDLLIRDLDPETYDRMQRAAAARRKSLMQIARETLTERFGPSREEVWAKIKAIRESIGPVSGNSVELIRKAREWPRS